MYIGRTMLLKNRGRDGANVSKRNAKNTHEKM